MIGYDFGKWTKRDREYIEEAKQSKGDVPIYDETDPKYFVLDENCGLGYNVIEEKPRKEKEKETQKEIPLIEQIIHQKQKKKKKNLKVVA